MKKYVSLLFYFLALVKLPSPLGEGLGGEVFSQSIDNHFKLDQIGYQVNDQKICVISNPQAGYNAPDSYTPGGTLEVRKQSDNSLVFSAAPTPWNGGTTHTQSGDRAWWFNFSSFITPGDYYVFDAANNKRSYSFSIGNNVYNDALKHAIRFFYYQRCGMAKTAQYAGMNYTDIACHKASQQDLNCRDVTQPGNISLEKDLSGGWHDAGDYNKYTNFCFGTVNYLLDAYEQNPSVFKDNYGIPESGNGIPDILDEIKYELDWLLKMQNSDGSALMKVSTLGFTGGSPPSTDTPQRLYGPAASSATRTLASLFSHGSIIYKTIPSMVPYSNNLLTKAELAWAWLQANPGNSNYNNSGFGSANPEVSAYAQNSTSLTAAIYLFAASGTAAYRTYIDNNYNIQPLQWTYWYPFEAVYQDALLYYCTTAGATIGIVNTIKNNCITSVSTNNADLLPAYNTQKDTYMAQMQDNDYVWGNNQNKCEVGNILYNMVHYNLDAANQTNYRNAAEGYIHYLHGVNPNGIAFLTNANVFGGDNFTKEIYHGWFGDGTAFDGGISPYIGPPPAFIPGGVNPNYSPDAAYTGPPISPPNNQPVQKSYKDWNTSYPENSWEISEVGIYVNAAYVKLLSKFADSTSVSTAIKNAANEFNCTVYPNPSSGRFTVSGLQSIVSAINIYDIYGKLVYQTNINGEQETVSVNLSNGIYFIKTHNKVYSKTDKIIIVNPD
ncbi:MAG: T9SS type A sorting domain-containing protein [Bacteroidetes bacterium]|nr:MAG: T9SS type A sorting domain-containing protein [Bacteroidota bacterium]